LRLRKIAGASHIGCAGMFLCSILQFGCYCLGFVFWAYEIFMFIMLFCVGMVFTSATTLAMTEGRAMIGWASALVGATGFLFGGIVTPLVGIGEIQLSTYCVMGVCSFISMLFSYSVSKSASAIA
ncbi:MAG: hypothetical protein K2I54_05660, partial [Muribaculaceae bacterium]|nr:hypothetical protein [Muribaculaceae bacterium]